MININANSFKNLSVAFTVKATIFVVLLEYSLINLAFSIETFLSDFSKKTNPI